MQNPDATLRDAIKRPLLLAALLLLGTISILKGLHTNRLDYGLYFWALDYSQGFVQRGLAGEVFRWFMPNDAGALQHFGIVVAILHYVVVFSLMILAARLGAWATFRMHGTWERWATGLTYALLLTSPVFPTLAFMAGYMDPWCLLVILAGAWSVVSLSSWLAVPFLVASILLNQGSLFLAFPVLAFAIVTAEKTPMRRATSLGLLAAGVIGTALLVQSHRVPDREYFSPRWNEIGVPEKVVDNLYREQFEQDLAYGLELMRGLIRDNTAIFLRSVAAALLIAAAPLILGYRLLRKRTRGEDRDRFMMITLGLFTLAPLGVLLLAHDLSRFLTWFLAAAWVNLSLVIFHFSDDESESPAS